MLTKDQIESIVRKWIADKEILGENTGENGHPANKDYELETIHEPESTSTGWKVGFDYTVFVTTEFTAYPDNPPYEYPKKGVLELDRQGNLISEQEEGEW